MILLENRLPADDSHEIPCLICVIFEKSGKICKCRLLQIIGGAFRVNSSSSYRRTLTRFKLFSDCCFFLLQNLDFKFSFKNTNRVSHSFCLQVRPDMGPKCLQKLSADDIGR